MTSLNEAMEEWTGGPHGPVPAAVALSHVTLRALTLPEAASYFTQRRKEKGLTSLSPSSLHPRWIKGSVREQGSILQIYLCLLTGKAPLPRAQGLVPTQAQSLPPFQPPKTSPPNSGHSRSHSDWVF